MSKILNDEANLLQEIQRRSTAALDLYINSPEPRYNRNLLALSIEFLDEVMERASRWCNLAKLKLSATNPKED